jgi:hypothetical protein
VFNLSSVYLHPIITKLLSYGMQFQPIILRPVSELREMLRNSVSQFCSDVARNFASLECHSVQRPIRINLAGSDSDWSTVLWKFHSTFRRKCSWADSAAQDSLNLEHSSLLRFLNFNLEFAVNSTFFLPFSNLSSEELSILGHLRSLVRRKQIIISKADKGRQWIIANYDDYYNAVLRFIDSSGNYQRIPFNSKFKTAAQIKRVINNFAELLDVRTRLCLLAHTDNPKSRRFYGLAKIHKPRNVWVDNFPPIRPICPDVGTETANSAKYIALALKPIMMAGFSFIKSSAELVKLISTLHNLPASCILLTVDIDALYPSIPPVLAFQCIKIAVNKYTPNDKVPQRHSEFILELLKIQLFGNTMEFGNEVFEQISGIPMGRAWAPAVASIFMDHWDALVLAQLSEPPLMYKRYLDDVFVVAKSELHAKNIIRAMQHSMVCIKVGTHNVGRSVNFLDLQLTVVDNLSTYSRHCSPYSCSELNNATYQPNGVTINSKLYRKPLDLGVVLDFNSGHSFNTKVGVLYGQCVRICGLSTRISDAGQDTRNLIELMINLRHCPVSVRRKLHKRLLLFSVSRVCSFQPINEQFTSNLVNKYRMCVRLRVPLSANTHFLEVALSNFRKRLSLVENDRVTSRIAFKTTSNFARLLIYK